MRTEFGSWRRVWRRISKAEIKMEINKNIIKKKLEEKKYVISNNSHHNIYIFFN